MSINVLTLPLSQLRGVGERTEIALAKMNLYNYGDLLFHFPLRYEDRTQIQSIAMLQHGDRVMIEGTVDKVSVQGRGRRRLTCVVSDGSASITLMFFHFTKKQIENLQGESVPIRCFGEVRVGYRGGLEMAHPEYRTGLGVHYLEISDRLTAVYPVVKGVSTLLLRKLVSQIWGRLEQEGVAELLTPEVLQQNNWPNLLQTLKFVHEPPVGADIELLQQGIHPVQKRLAFEELLAHQLSLVKVRQKIQKKPTYKLNTDSQKVRDLLASLSFELTGAQQRVLNDIRQDLEQPYPALRLVQGDVGSGKTILSALAMLMAVEAGLQAALMAPTELLAEQHYRNFCQWLEPLGVRVTVLTSGLKAAVKRQRIAGIASQEYDVVIGTHALFQAQITFAQLAVVVVDEQHRFGVHQRLSLVKKGENQGRVPHQFIMTATPIPRTLSMTAYGDLDCSVIDELPPGRKPITTCLISQDRRSDVMGKVLQHCMTGQQVYWVCTLVDESEALEAQAAETVAQELHDALPDLVIGLVHGRMSSTEKDCIMQDYLQKKIQVLVATTVIEVGVDVANATLMVIDNPERLGLAQLHQLRGRVGRGSQESYCFLLCKKQLSVTAKQRLTIMRDSQDGFYIAEQDLLMRGPGEVLGVRQSGLVDLKVANLIRDQGLLTQVQTVAKTYWEHRPESVELLLQRWLKHAVQFAHV
jgi:ATP-dependent DNA helicase RecG